MPNSDPLTNLPGDLAALAVRVAALEASLARLLARWEWLMTQQQSHQGGYAVLPPLPDWWGS